MHFAVTLRVLGILLMLFSLTMVPPLVIALLADDHSAIGFLSAFGITFFSGLLMWLPLRDVQQELRIRDGFLITSLFWTVLGTFGALPLALAEGLELSPVDAIFESISGLTSSGGTVITGLDALPPSILFYRQLLQWMGGIGIIVVAVAVLPMLGIGGMQLYKAETPGPSKDNKLTPRIAGTAKALFICYVILTAACAITYYLLGMSVFDAIGHSFSTIALGGFSTHDSSLGYFNSNAILIASSFFMLISGINFGLHFLAWRRRSLKVYQRDSETRFYIVAVSCCILTTIVILIYTNTHGHHESVIHGVFQVISIITTTGYSTENVSVWPAELPILAIFFSCMGGCVGSTAGGIKTMRLMLIYKQGIRELKQLVHPQAVIPLKVGRRRVEATVVSAVWSFFAVYTTAFIILLLAMMACGMDFTTGFSAVAASLNNLGMGIAGVASGFGDISETAKLIMCFAMLLGRLEIFTLLVLFTPAFWRT
ncbi:potassium transporter [Mangrovimicrobium sediminis]|uniref:Trk system potassium uptake protein n=1 Tax=Mangrovimicrobium sediminis TaxID=2562682 RepID=A0A4Z0LZW2_9GAMM|nr:TrkH family potassium uptake protein [Haliea sp. SAOS-164]TGD72811.1 potassium transporter [Haliea sp. SAOS-164]